MSSAFRLNTWQLRCLYICVLLCFWNTPKVLGRHYALKSVQRIEKGTIYFQEPTTKKQYILTFERGKYYTFIFPDGQKETLTNDLFYLIPSDYDLAVKVAKDKVLRGKHSTLDKDQNLTFHYDGHNFKLPNTILADIHALYSNNGDLKTFSFGIDTEQGFHVSMDKWVSFPTFFLFLFALIGIYIWRLRKRYELKLAVAEGKLQIELARAETEKVRADSRKWLFDQQEQYLRELGQGLHDDHLNNLKNVMRRVQGLLDANTSVEVQTELRDIRQGLSGVADKLHRVSETLFPRWVKDLSLQEALEIFIEDEYKTEYPHLEVKSHLEKDRKCFSESERFQLYRVFQEAMHNAAIHGHAKSIRVTLMKDEQHLSGTIEDDGRGFVVPESIEHAAKESKRLGLLGIQERVYMLNGTIKWHSEVGKGTQVTFKIPLHS